MSRTVTLKISNCMDCPYHQIVAATLDANGKNSVILDPFKQYPIDIVCHKNGHPVRQIIQSIFPGQPDKLRSLCKIPEWCPLIKGSKQ